MNVPLRWPLRSLNRFTGCHLLHFRVHMSVKCRYLCVEASAAIKVSHSPQGFLKTTGQIWIFYAFKWLWWALPMSHPELAFTEVYSLPHLTIPHNDAFSHLKRPLYPDVSNKCRIFHRCHSFLNHCLVDTTWADERFFSLEWFLVSVTMSE